MDNKEQPGIRADYIPGKAEKEMLERVYERFRAMKESPERQKAEKVWKKGREQWEAMRQEREDWQSNHYVPLTTAVIETALSEISNQNLRPIILGRGSEDVPRAVVMSHIFDYTWENSDSDLEFEDILHDAFICGTGIGQEYFYRDLRRIKTSLKKDSKIEYNDEVKAIYEDCFLESVKLEDFFIDENARGFTGPFAARDAIRRYIMTEDNFKSFFQGKDWNPLDNAKYVKPGGDTNYYEYYAPPQGVDHSKMIEVLWYWAVKPDDWLVVVANDVVVVMGPNPYKHKQLPFARAVDIKRTHAFYGKGTAELLESIQDEMNTLRRMIIDRNHLDIDKMFIGSSRINLSDEDLIARPHGFIPSDEPGSVTAVEYGDIPRSVELSLKHLEDDSTICTGINPRAQALPTAGTATEAAILKESTLKRLQLKVRRINREFLTRVARLRVANILQYYPQKKQEAIIGEEATAKYQQIRLENKQLDWNTQGQMVEKNINGFSFFELKKDYYYPAAGAFDIKYAAGSTLPISEPLMKQEMTEMYDRLIQVALGMPNTYDPMKLGDELLRINHKNPDDFHAQAQGQEQDGARMEMSLKLATMEDDLIMKGQPIPPTAFQPITHTALHQQFTGSPAFQALKGNDPRIQIMVDHITGELTAVQSRQGGMAPQGQEMMPGGQTPPTMGGGGLPARQQQTPKSQAGGNKTLTAILPNKTQGGGQIPRAF